MPSFATVAPTHGTPVVFLPGGAPAGAYVSVSTDCGDLLWRSHPLAAGREAVTVDVRDGRFVGVAGGWSILPAGGYLVRLNPETVELGVLRVIDRIDIAASFGVDPAHWFSCGIAWHGDGRWRASRSIRSEEGRSFLFVDAAMHGSLHACCRLPLTPSPASWGLIIRHYNDGNHLRLVLQHTSVGLRVCLQRMAASIDSAYLSIEIAVATLSFPMSRDTADQSDVDGDLDLKWTFNGDRHEICVNGDLILTGFDGYMGGVEVVGLFADASGDSNGPSWSAFKVCSTQWVPYFPIDRAGYRAVIRPGNIHQLQPAVSNDRRAAWPDPRTNIFWESGIQFGHIGGSEIKFTQGAGLDLLSSGSVVDLVRWYGPMPKFIDQDHDIRGHARGTAAFYDRRIVIADWVDVSVRRSVGPDFDVLSRAMTGPARIALAPDGRLRPWTLPADGSQHEITVSTAEKLFPIAMVFPFRVAGRRWDLIASVGGLLHTDGTEPARAFAWECPRRLTASHDLRIAPTMPGIVYGFWITVRLVPHISPQDADHEALRLRADFSTPAAVRPDVGDIVERAPDREQPAAALALDGCFDRGLGVYRLTADAGVATFLLDPLGVVRDDMAFLITDLDVDTDPTCSVDGTRLAAGSDFQWQPYPADGLAPSGASLIQLNRRIAEPTMIQIRSL